MVSCVLSAGAQQHDDAGHFADVNRRGDMGMGFDHSKTTHHFLLLKEGGAIRVEANSPEDTVSRNQIRKHLEMVASMFKAGDFSLPMFIHDTTPPGVETMKRSKDVIHYTYEETPQGAQVHIASSDASAVAAIHEFLRFQIQDHQTGDPTPERAGRCPL